MLQADQKLRKEERLKSRKLIKSLFETGHVIQHYPFKVLFKLNSTENVGFRAKMAVSVSKKNFKRAVDRIKIKRKIRESYRLNKNQFYKDLDKYDQNIDFFVIYTPKGDIDFKTLNEAMIMLLKKLTKRIEF